MQLELSELFDIERRQCFKPERTSSTVERIDRKTEKIVLLFLILRHVQSKSIQHATSLHLSLSQPRTPPNHRLQPLHPRSHPRPHLLLLHPD